MAESILFNKKVLLVCSSGGHLFEMFALKDFWKDYERMWVCFSTADAKYLLKEEAVAWAYSPTNRDVWNLIRNFFLAWKVLKKQKPFVIVSTGAGVGVPFIIIGSLFGIRTIYVESITRTKELSLTARLIYPFVYQLIVQWPELAKKYSKAEYHGQII